MLQNLGLKISCKNMSKLTSESWKNDQNISRIIIKTWQCKLKNSLKKLCLLALSITALARIIISSRYLPHLLIWIIPSILLWLIPKASTLFSMKHELIPYFHIWSKSVLLRPIILITSFTISIWIKSCF